MQGNLIKHLKLDHVKEHNELTKIRGGFVHVLQRVKPEPGHATMIAFISDLYRVRSIQLLKNNRNIYYIFKTL